MDVACRRPATGLVTDATGIFVIPAVPYLQVLNLEREDLIQALGLSFTVSTIALAIALPGGPGQQASSVALIGGSLMALIPAIAGMFLGQWLRSKMSVPTFRQVFFVGLLMLGLYLAAEAIM
ncbi:TSUP family transporter [Brucella pseudogrignonensis]|uniref:TSUP family transporter n=1 Tax=Brucella pseudogrignonensis TaxID=419475 RepID=UPI0039C682D1